MIRRLVDIRVAAPLGIAVVVAAFVLGPVRRLEPFFTYFYWFAWGPFLWVIGAALARRSPNHPLLRARRLVPLFPFSVTLWLVFEVVNFRLGNWSYHGLPSTILIRWLGYAIAFSTVVPGVLLTAALIDPASLIGRPQTPSGPGSGRFFVVAGLLMLALPMMAPRYFFPLVWGFAFFILDPWVARHGGRSLIADWRAGEFRLTKALLIAGLVCGGYWEICNFWAGAKWMYRVPFVGRLKLFEMPVLGFLGFPPFALEIHAIVEAFRLWRAKASFPARLAMSVATAVFWILAFVGIDRFTVRP